MAILRSLVVSLLARTDNFDQGMRKAEASLRGFSASTTTFQVKLRGLSTELLKFSAAQAGIASALDATRKVFQTGLSLERIQQGLVNVTGSSAAAKQAMLLLQQTARETGFSLDVLGQGFIALQTASRGTTLSFEDVTNIFTQFMRAARAAGVPADQLGNVFEEVTQLINQQTLTMQDLLPLLKQFPGIMDAAARGMGMTRDEFERAGQSGELLTTVVLPRLAEELGKTTTQHVQPLTDAVKQLRTAWDELWQTLAKSGVLEFVTRQIKDLVSFLKSNEGWLTKLLRLLPLVPSIAEAPGTGGLAPGQPRPGDVVPPPEGSTTAPPPVDTSREREIQRLEQALDKKSAELDALLRNTQERIQKFPRDAETILKGALETADTLIREMETMMLQLERSLRELEQQGQKTTAQAGKVAAVTPQTAAIIGKIQELAPQYGLDPRLVQALVKRESAFDPRAVSKAGAQGLTQLMPGTAKMLGVTDPFDIEQNLRGGMKYLSDLLKQFNGDMEKALAAYNAGPGRVLQAEKGRPLPTETQKYVPAVLAEYERLKASGTDAMDQTAAATATGTQRLEEMQDRLAKVRQQFQELASVPEQLQQNLSRLAAEDRYIELLIETQNEVNALTMSEEQLKLTSLERMQRQAVAQRELQAAMRKSPQAVSELVQAELAARLEERNQLQAMETIDALRSQQQGSVDDLVGSLEDQVRVLTMTNRQYLEYQLHLRNATAGEVAHALALEDKVERLGMARQAADQVTDALIDMAVTGEINLKNLQETFSRMALEMIADAIDIRESLTKLIEKGLELAINALPSGAGSGTASAAEAGAAVEGFRAAGYGGGLQHGGAVVPGRFYTVGEAGSERFYPGVAGTVVPGGRPVVINMTVNTPDADSFRRSGNQIAAQMVGAAQRARRVM